MATSALLKVILMLVLAAAAAILIIRNQKLRVPIQIALGIAIIILAYWIYDSVMDPIRFEKARDIRENAAIEKLKDIRSAEEAFKEVYKGYAPTWDSLFDFIENGKMAVVFKEGKADSLTEEAAIKAGLIKTDTTFVPVLESVFGDKPADFDFRDLKFVPFTDKQETFFLDAGTVSRLAIDVPVFEASVKYEVLLKGLKQQYIDNIIDLREELEKFPGLKVGSMEEPTKDGNWE